MEDIYPILEWIDKPGKKVIATIIHVEGSAYKREGSAMLFLENGTQIGMIGAGCLEEDLSYRVKEVMENEGPSVVQYDLREETDISWGQGAGCNGIIEILLEPMNERIKSNLSKLKHLLSSNIPVLLLKDHEDFIYIPQYGEPFGEWNREIPAKFGFVKSGKMDGLPIYQHLYRPKPRLIIFGAGPDVRPLVSVAAMTGFSVVVCDWREAFCTTENFPDAEQLLVGFPKEMMNKLVFTPYDFIVIASHHFQRDKEFLLNLPVALVSYIGILGSKERTERLIGENNIHLAIHSPIGLSIGAKGPEEIAISIMAELIKEWQSPLIENIEHLWTVPE